MRSSDTGVKRDHKAFVENTQGAGGCVVSMRAAARARKCISKPRIYRWQQRRDCGMKINRFRFALKTPLDGS